MDWKHLFSKPEPGPQLTPELRARIEQSFDRSAADEEHFPSTIDPRIYHVKLIREHLSPLAGKRVLDVGCGKGRFLRVLREQEPSAEYWGLDISDEMLRFVPPEIQTRRGAMTETAVRGRVLRRRLRHRIAGARRRDRPRRRRNVPRGETRRAHRHHR